MAGTVLDVEPQDFVTSSGSASAAARAIASAGSTLRSALSGSSEMAGSDPAGSKWSTQYDQVAADAVAGLDSLENALGQISAGLAVTGLNYATADWLSCGRSGHAPGYATPSLPALMCSSPPPSAAGGSTASDIPGWHYVADFIGEMWPNGDPGKLRSARSGWNVFADRLDAVHSSDVTRITSDLDGTKTPEMQAIHSTVSRVASGVTGLATEARNLAKACGDLADQIEKVHDQTRKVVADLVEQLAATALVGIGLTIVTAGISDAAGALAAGGEVAIAVSRILSFIAELGTEVGRVVDTIATSAGSIARVAGISESITIRVVTIAGRSVVTGVGGAATNVGVTEITDPGADLDDAAVQGFIGGAAFGVVGQTARLAGTAMGARDAAKAAQASKLTDFKSQLVTWSANGPSGYLPYGSLTEKRWFNTFFNGFSEKGYPEWKWPTGYKGFVDKSATPNTLSVGDVISRISPKLSNGKLGDGEFATDPGTDFRNLALPPDRLSPDFVTTKYEVLKPLPPIVLEGPIKPWFDQPGLGKQYFFNKGMQQYVDAGYLKAVP